MNSINNKINFIGVGAEKAGTTWLADCLREHPEIFIPKEKELFFFNDLDPHYLKIKNLKYDWGIGWYLKQFNKAPKNSIKGEFTPTYLYCRRAAQRIKKHFPDIKILVILREPAARTFSQYLNDKKLGLNKKLNFEDSIKRHFSYLQKSLYYEHIKNYLSVFEGKNIMVLILEDFKKNKEKNIKKVFEFLNLKNTDFIPPGLYKNSNTAVSPKLFLLNSFMIKTEIFLKKNKLDFLLKMLENLKIRNLAIKIRELNTKKIKKYPAINPLTKKNLKKFFLKDVQKLEKLINKDLSIWKI